MEVAHGTKKHEALTDPATKGPAPFTEKPLNKHNRPKLCKCQGFRSHWLPCPWRPVPRILPLRPQRTCAGRQEAGILAHPPPASPPPCLPPLPRPPPPTASPPPKPGGSGQAIPCCPCGKCNCEEAAQAHSLAPDPTADGKLCSVHTLGVFAQEAVLAPSSRLRGRARTLTDAHS